MEGEKWFLFSSKLFFFYLIVQFFKKAIRRNQFFRGWKVWTNQNSPFRLGPVYNQLPLVMNKIEARKDQSRLTFLNSLDPQGNSISRGERGTCENCQGNLRLGWGYKLVFQQKLNQSNLDLHQGEPHTDTRPRTCSERHKLVRVTGVLRWTSESLGIELLRVGPGLGIMMEEVHRNDHLQSRGNMNATDVVIFSAFPG